MVPRHPALNRQLLPIYDKASVVELAQRAAMEHEEIIIASCSWVMETLTQALEARHHQVERSFDLNNATRRSVHPAAAPFLCECIVVLFVYEEGETTPPVLIVAQGRDEITILRIRADDKLPVSIVDALDDTISAAASRI